MNTVLQYNLSAHIIFGLLGIIAFYAVWMGLLKQKLSLRFLRYFSLVGFVSFLISWFTGGYYYVTYYGKAVRPIIKAGQYPWAHSVIMETKEHVFLFLPFLAAVAFLTFWLLGERIGQETKIKRALTSLTGLIAVLGIAITLAGVIISGAVR